MWAMSYGSSSIAFGQWVRSSQTNIRQVANILRSKCALSFMESWVGGFPLFLQSNMKELFKAVHRIFDDSDSCQIN